MGKILSLIEGIEEARTRSPSHRVCFEMKSTICEAKIAKQEMRNFNAIWSRADRKLIVVKQRVDVKGSPLASDFSSALRRTRIHSHLDAEFNVVCGQHN